MGVKVSAREKLRNMSTRHASVRSEIDSSRNSLARTRTAAELSAGVLGAVVAGLYTLFSWMQWRNWVTPSWDLGIFTQMAKAYAAFEQPIVSIKGHGFNLWGDHFHPILLVLGPIYKLFPSPFTLLVVQNLLIGLSVYLLIRYSARLIPLLGAICVGLAYALSFGIQEAVAVQFHEVAFALPFLVASLSHLVLARTELPQLHVKKAVLWALPLVFVKEDMGLTVAALGLVAMMRSGWLASVKDAVFPVTHEGQKSPRQWRSLVSGKGSTSGVVLAAWGVFWTLASVAVILPAFNVGGVFDYSNKIDAKAVLADPLQSAGLMFFPWEKSLTWLALLLTGVFVWIFSPLALVALPTLAWRFLSPNEGYWGTGWHYSLVLMPVVFCALLDVIVSLRGTRYPWMRRGGEHAAHRAKLLKLMGYPVLPIATLVVALLSIPSLPLSDLTGTQYESPSYQQSLTNKQNAANTVPAGASVASDLSVLTYLIPEREVYWIGGKNDPAPDYVVIDQQNSAWGSTPVEYPVQYAGELYASTYEEVAHFGSVYVMKRI